MTFLSGLANGTKRGPAFLLSIVLASFLSGMVTWSLISLLNCNCPPQRIIQQLPAVKEVQVSTASSSSSSAAVDWSTSDFGRFWAKCGPTVSPDAIKSTLLDKVYRGVSPYVDFPPEFAKPYLKSKYIHGWGSTGSVFKRLMGEVRPKIIIELGSFLGASAIHMATLAKTMFDHQVLILCTDDFRLWPGYQDMFNIQQVHGDAQVLYQFLQNVKTMNVSDNILPLPFSTSTALSVMCAWGITADLIEVDAGHDFHSAWSDINLAYALLRPGGTMFGHDYYLEMDERGVGRAVDLFAKLKGYRVEVDGEHWILRGN